MIGLSKFEAVDSALDALLRAGDFLTCDDGRAWVRKSNVLLDACIDAGMPYDQADHKAWAIGYVSDALVSA